MSAERRCPPRQGPYRHMAPVAQAELLEQRLDPGTRDPGRQVPQSCRELQVLEDAEIAIERGLLEHETDATAHLESRPHDVVAAHPCAAPGGREQRGEEVDRRRLPRPVGTQQTEKLALVDLEIECVYGAHRAEILAETARLDGERTGHPPERTRDAGAAR